MALAAVVRHARAALLTLVTATPMSPLSPQLPPAALGPGGTIALEEATIEQVHAALAAGALTCEELAQGYLDRIEAYDDRGPALNAMLTLHPRVLETAREMDQRGAAGAPPGPLHCIPVILKDNYETRDLPTSGGSRTLAGLRTERDAFVVGRLREAGALILGKANLTELALVGTTVSSLGGQTLNPYDLTRTPGGSSGGTGAAIAAGFAILGTGSDTGQSTRSPASAQSLVGVRPTRGLVSRSGVIPVSWTQDELGPITRTVQDAARMLGVMAGYDPADPITAFGRTRRAEDYTAALDQNGLRGARIGLLRDFMGTGAIHAEVNLVVRSAVDAMEGLGATVIELEVPGLVELSSGVNVMEYEFRVAFDGWLEGLGSRAPVRTTDEFVARGEYHEGIASTLEPFSRVVDGLSSPEYHARLRRREELRQALMTVMAEHRLDALLYPHQKRLVARIGEEQLERNGVLSHGTGFPAVTFPGGFSSPGPTAPLGVPVGIELLGPEWSEALLLRLAYAFQEGTRVRRPPASTPPLR